MFECSAFEDLRRTHSQLFGPGPGVEFDMRQFFAHTDQRAVVMYILVWEEHRANRSDKGCKTFEAFKAHYFADW